MENQINKMKILIIDDDANLNTVLVNKFKVFEYDAMGASNGEEGLKKAFEFHPDIILLDLVMPVMDGMEVLKRLRMDTWGKTAKVIMLTLIDKMDSIVQAMDNNVMGYLVKTNYSLDDIIKEVNQILKNKN